ncbi:hypothetical protein AB0301_16015 [Microbacterium profundi]|uniref:HTTM domain-containing protein n=1 Tax=Microbacterium profundi TaxID=450380 RepID=A0ABV3LKW8_9MICO
MSAIEELTGSPRAAREEYLPWRVARVQFPRIFHSRLLEHLFSARVGKAVAAIRLGTAVLLFFGGTRSRLARGARVLQASTQVYQTVQGSGFGQDGADQALIVEQASQLAAAFSPAGGAGEGAARYFLSAQAVLSYFSSGIVKLISPVWRSGDAMLGITRTTSYGSEVLNSLMRRYPVIRKAAAWGVIIGETSAPLALILPRPARLVWQASMILMHVSIAAFMGLNRFMWAFVSLHPVLDQTVDELQQNLINRTPWAARGTGSTRTRRRS